MTTLRFATSGADACALDPGGVVQTTGSVDVAVTATTTYTLRCAGAGGVGEAEATVVVPPCTNECAFDVDHPVGLCTGAAFPTDGAGLFQIDVGGGDAGVYVEVEVCDPTGFAFVLSDSATSDGFGGDVNPGATCYDAELQVTGSVVEVYRNDFAPLADRRAASIADLISPTGCTTLRIVVEDGRLSIDAPGRAPLVDDQLFRLSPAGACLDAQLAGDRRWFLAFERTPLGRVDRIGDGVTSARACVR
jgi:hypothetical protein